MTRFIAVAACAALVLGARAEARGGGAEGRSSAEHGVTQGSAEATAQGADEQGLGQRVERDRPTARPGTFTESGTGLGTRHDTALGKSGVSARDGASAGRGQAMQGESQSVSGTVDSIQDGSLAIRGDGGETHELSVGPDTRFVREGREISRDELSEGDQVRASFSGEAGAMRATEIHVMDGGSSTGVGSGMGGGSGAGGATGTGTGGAGGTDAQTGLEEPPRR